MTSMSTTASTKTQDGTISRTEECGLLIYRKELPLYIMCPRCFPQVNNSLLTLVGYGLTTVTHQSLAWVRSLYHRRPWSQQQTVKYTCHFLSHHVPALLAVHLSTLSTDLLHRPESCDKQCTHTGHSYSGRHCTQPT
jgi:hypothetical protein